MKIFFIVVILFVVLDVLLVFYVIWRRTRQKLSPGQIEEIKANWKRIIQQGDHRHAVMDADNLLDQTLQRMGYRGNLGNKLKKAEHLFSNINKVWSAHKIRNNIAHQINFSIEDKTYHSAMLAFKQAFKDLKIF